MFSEVSAVARLWWIVAVLGLLSVAVGIAALVWPDITLLAIGVLAGVYLLIAAALEIVEAFFGESGDRAISAILGVLAVVAGLICIRRPGASLVAVVVAVGIYLVAAGIFRIVRAFARSEERWLGVGLGVLDVAIGAVILAWPGLGLATAAIFFGISMLVHGVFALIAAFRLRSLRDLEPPPVQTASYAG